jgi:hypothetical protein
LDNVTGQSGVLIENELQTHQSVEVNSINDLIIKVRHWKPTKHNNNNNNNNNNNSIKLFTFTC